MMSRSRRKTPIGGNSDSSEKKDKKIWHGRMRSRERDKLRKIILKTDYKIMFGKHLLCWDSYTEYDKHLTTLVNEVSNPWNMSKDGKQHYELCLDENWLKEQYYIDTFRREYRYSYIFNKQLFKIAIKLLPITKECRKYINRERSKLLGK